MGSGVLACKKSVPLLYVSHPYLVSLSFYTIPVLTSQVFQFIYRLYCLSMEIRDLDGPRGPELQLYERSEDATKGSEAI